MAQDGQGLAEKLASGQGLSKDDIEHWHDRLTTGGARWVDGFGHPRGQGEGLGTPGPALVSAEEAELRAQLASTRFWAEQEGEQGVTSSGSLSPSQAAGW
jgi:hypothetical protein